MTCSMEGFLSKCSMILDLAESLIPRTCSSHYSTPLPKKHHPSHILQIRISYGAIGKIIHQLTQTLPQEKVHTY